MGNIELIAGAQGTSENDSRRHRLQAFIVCVCVCVCASVCVFVCVCVCVCVCLT